MRWRLFELAEIGSRRGVDSGGEGGILCESASRHAEQKTRSHAYRGGGASPRAVIFVPGTSSPPAAAPPAPPPVRPRYALVASGVIRYADRYESSPCSRCCQAASALSVAASACISRVGVSVRVGARAKGQNQGQCQPQRVRARARVRARVRARARARARVRVRVRVGVWVRFVAGRQRASLSCAAPLSSPEA